LEELRNTEEKGGGFIGGEFLPSEEEKGDFGEQSPASQRGYGRRVEESS